MCCWQIWVPPESWLCIPIIASFEAKFWVHVITWCEPWAPWKSPTFPSKGTGIMMGMGCPFTSASASEPSVLGCWCPSTSLLQYHSVLLTQPGKLESLVVLVLYVHFFRAALVFYVICISTQILDSVCKFLQKVPVRTIWRFFFFLSMRQYREWDPLNIKSSSSQIQYLFPLIFTFFKFPLELLCRFW